MVAVPGAMCVRLKPRVFAIHADEKFMGEEFLVRHDLYLDPGKGSELPGAARCEVHCVETPVLVSSHVLQIKDLAPVMTPEIGPNTPITIGG